MSEDGTIGRQYAICAAQSFEYTFAELNLMGGRLFSEPSASPLTVCINQSFELFGNYSGLLPNGTIINYRWSLLSGPSGSTFTTITGTITHPTGVIPPVTITPTIPGTYSFELQVSYPYQDGFIITSENHVDVLVYELGNPNCACYKDPAPGTGTSSKFGITSLGRAGTDQTQWPQVQKGGHLVIESETKGFVINRVADTSFETIPSPVEGMMVFDLSADQVKIYSQKEGDTGPFWHVFSTPACPPTP